MDTLKVRNNGDKPMMVLLGREDDPVIRMVNPGEALDLGVYARRSPPMDPLGRVIVAYCILSTLYDGVAGLAAGDGGWLAAFVAGLCVLGYGMTLRGVWRATR